MNIPQLSKENINKLYLQKRYPEFYNYILEVYKDYSYSKFSELIYCYKHNIKEHPKCPICGKNVPFLDFNRGYQAYCSLRCSNSSAEVKEKKKLTNIKNFGVEYAAQSDKIKEKTKQICIERYGGMGNASESIKLKQYQTMENKYGDKYALKNESIKEKAVNTTMKKHGGMGAGSIKTKEKIIRACHEKYGVDWVLKSENIREKIKQTNIMKYGTETPVQNEVVRNKIKQSKRENFINKHSNIIGTEVQDDDIIYIVKCPHQNCTKCENKYYKIKSSCYWDRLKDNTEPCTNLLRVQKSNSKNTSLEIFIKNILDEHNISYIENDRTILDGKELDIYIPNKNIAIECNGIYWHSLKEPNYHMDKWKLCKDKNIQLITIWQDWIINKPEIVKSILLSKLGIYDKRIYARKCIIKELTPHICNEFLNKNHIQGAGKSKIRLGLYYDDELVCVMTFNNKIKCSGDNKNDDYYFVLTRFCSSMGVQVIGGAGKLLQYFINKYHPISISSFASNDISDGGLYKTLKFKEVCINKSYWYIDKTYNRYHRSTFTKASIVERGWKETKCGWKEKDVMYEHGYFQIYDSGQIKYILE